MAETFAALGMKVLHRDEAGRHCLCDGCSAPIPAGDPVELALFPVRIHAALFNAGIETMADVVALAADRPRMVRMRGAGEIARAWICRAAVRVSPSEPTRAELAAQLAAVTAERDALRADMRKVLEAAEALADIGAARAAVERATTEAHRDDLRAALATARREGAEGMREVVKAEIRAAFHYNDPPADGVERPIGPIPGQWEAHQTLRKLLSRVCAVLTDGGAS